MSPTFALMLWTTPECRSCIAYKPALQDFARKINLPLYVYDASDETNEALRARCEVESVPTTVIMADGKPLYAVRVADTEQVRRALLRAMDDLGVHSTARSVA